MTLPKNQKLTNVVDRVIGSRIAAFRVAKGLSQTSLANAIGVSFQQVQKYEKGRNRVGASRIKMIADQLELPIEMLFDGLQRDGDQDTSTPICFSQFEVVELVQAFMRITDPTTRATVLSIAKAKAVIR